MSRSDTHLLLMCTTLSVLENCISSISVILYVNRIARAFYYYFLLHKENKYESVSFHLDFCHIFYVLYSIVFYFSAFCVFPLFYKNVLVLIYSFYISTPFIAM